MLTMVLPAKEDNVVSRQLLTFHVERILTIPGPVATREPRVLWTSVAFYGWEQSVLGRRSAVAIVGVTEGVV